MSSLFSKITSSIDRSMKKNEGPFFTYLIGNNGSGKSRILKALTEHYSESHSSHVRSIACISNSVYDRFFELGKYPKVQYMGSRSVNNAVFHAAIDRELAKYITSGISTKRNFFRTFEAVAEIDLSIKFAPISKSKTDLSGFIDKRKVKGRTLADVLPLQEQRWILSIVHRSFQLKKLTKAQATTLNSFLNLNPSVELVTIKNDMEFSFKELSSGEQNRVLTAAKIMSAASDRSLIVIDEPEVSLHLHWQMEFHKNLSDMVGHLKNYHVVIATHSPIIVSEAARDRDVQKNIVVLGPEEQASPNYQIIKSANELNSEDTHTDQASEKFEEIQIITGTYFESRTIHSYDGLVLDFFDTATYNSKQVVEEVADIILQATDEGPKSVNFETQLRALLTKKGISKNDSRIVRKAVNLVKQHMKENNAQLSDR